MGDREGRGGPTVQVLFVCTGNACRSPMAEGLLRHLARAAGLDGQIRAFSAGTDPALPAPTDEAILVCQEQGIDISGHRPRPLTAAMVREADLVLGMARHHVEAVERECGPRPGQVALLTRYGPPDLQGRSIRDPFYRPLEEYRRCFELIRVCVVNLLAELRPRLEPGRPR
ncbi:MAG: low molecular weight phosphotyrosine protein phosphatase [Deltaproteobacteria bacterium]|nr:low molecular weight phosphotyrosine protein phosphatase [Deltaproteobacteria bacterium]